MRTAPWGSAAVAAATLACGTGEAPPQEARPGVELGRTAPLAVLRATSGQGPEAAVDLDPATAWTPARDPVLEAVVLEFEAPVELGSIDVVTCAGVSAVEVQLDGVLVAERAFDPPRTARTVVARIAAADGAACIRDVALHGADGKTLQPEPPRALPATLRATSTAEPQAVRRAAHLFDGRRTHAWAEGVPGDGMSQKLTLQFPEPRQVGGVEVWNGDQRSPEAFRDNNRVRQLRLVIDGRGAKELDLKDEPGPQRFDVQPALTGKEFTLEVVSTWPGDRTDDTVLSEVRFQDRDGAWTVALPDPEAAERQIRKALDGTPVEGALGVTLRSRCEKDAFKLRADASFAWHVAGDGAADVVEGVWVPGVAKGAWRSIELYGGRTSADPPAGRKGKPRPVDGPVEVATAASLGREALVAALEAMAKGGHRPRVACVLGDDAAIDALVAGDAVVVRGASVTDLFVR